MSPEGRVGGIEWHRIVESEEPDFEIFFLLPDATEETLAPHRDWLEPRFLDPASNKVVMAMQSYVLRTRHRTILVDSCVGNDKERRFHPPWARRSSSRYLDNLAAIGLAPEDIDFVMCTHLHADHVGWNTRLAGGRWVPTFANARYLFARTEYEHWIEINKGGKKYSDGCIDDSVLPVVEAGQAELVADDTNSTTRSASHSRPATRRAMSRSSSPRPASARCSRAISATPRCNAASPAGAQSAAPTGRSPRRPGARSWNGTATPARW